MTWWGAVCWGVSCFVLNHLVVFVVGLIQILSADAAPEPLSIFVRGSISAGCLLLASWGVVCTSWPRTTKRRALGIRLSHPALILAGFGLGLSLRLPSLSVANWVLRYWPRDGQAVALGRDYQTNEPVAVWIPLALVACLVAPILEELFYRGALFGALAGRAWLCAIWVPGLLFVVAHSDIRSWPSLGMMAAVLGCLRAQSGSCLPGIALHSAHNIAAIVDSSAFVNAPFQLMNSWCGALTVPVSTPLGMSLGGAIGLSWIVWFLSKGRRATLARAEDLA